MSLELNEIETNWLFSAESGFNQITLRHITATNQIENPKTLVITTEPPYHAQVWEYPPRKDMCLPCVVHVYHICQATNLFITTLAPHWGGGGVLHQIFSSRVQRMKKHLDPIGSKIKISKINEKVGQFYCKSGRKLIQNDLNRLNNTLCWSIRPTLGPIISVIKYDRDKLIFFCSKKGSIGLCWGIKYGPNWIVNPQNGGHHLRISLPYAGMGVPSPGAQVYSTCCACVLYIYIRPQIYLLPL